MSNWTKGPLTVGESTYAGTVVAGKDGVCVAWFGTARTDFGSPYSISPAEAHANAKLYAAAPELVDALKSIVAFLDAVTDPLIDEARAALAKAGA